MFTRKKSTSGLETKLCFFVFPEFVGYKYFCHDLQTSRNSSFLLIKDRILSSFVPVSSPLRGGDFAVYVFSIN